ncbi:uncharacterized protein LOC131933373 [Physella acuta]|uniref:uncharacterized protein LOC131933373 n=1 Tax=Physella acuta TaxID=109671 RepID=UPI0027DDA633|nr:uncharacterized protein LOC131933373 [Physella acuta]
MDKVLLLSTLLICMVYLPDMLNCFKKYPMEITGYEKDCVNYSCRYTGKIEGYIGVHELILDPNECKQRIAVRVCPRWERCFNGSAPWIPYCDLYVHCWEPEVCAETNNFPCYCSGTLPVKFKFFSMAENALYRLEATDPFDYGKILYVGNIFDSSMKPDNWDPVDNLGFAWREKDYSHSTNGEQQLHSEFAFLGIGALCVLLLA